MLPRRPADPFERTLWFMRHGATQPNLDGLRCGGDLDVPLTDIGREQVLRSAQLLVARHSRLDIIVASPLRRTMQSASIVARVLGGVPVETDDGLHERLLGRWNLQPIDATEAAMRSGATPPGGEAASAFEARVEAMARRMAARHADRRVLLIGSKGVARVLCTTLSHRSNTGAGPHAAVRNAELVYFDLGAFDTASPNHAMESATP